MTGNTKETRKEEREEKREERMGRNTAASNNNSESFLMLSLVFWFQRRDSCKQTGSLTVSKSPLAMGKKFMVFPWAIWWLFCISSARLGPQ